MIEVKPTLMDRMVAAFSPERGLKRVAARAGMAAAVSLSAKAPTAPGGAILGRGGYVGGHLDRRQTRGWFARLRSANADAIGDQQTLIARSRAAHMNMPLATAAIERKVTFTVGTGLMAIPELDASALGISEDAALALSSQIAADYDCYMASTDPDAERTATGYALQEIILRGVLASGDLLQIRVMPENQTGRISDTAWKLIEADRVVSPVGHIEGEALAAGPYEGRICVAGVVLDDYGAPLAYGVMKKAPAVYGFGARYGRMADDLVFIPAWGTRSPLPTSMLVMAKKRPEQARGVPMLASTLETLKQLSDLTEAELFAAVLQAMIAIVYKSPGATPMPQPDYGEAGSAEADQGLQYPDRPLNEQRFESGTVLEIDSAAGADMKTPGRPNPAFDPFHKALAGHVAAATGIPFGVLMLSFTNSYSASRGELEVLYVAVRAEREWLASMAETPRYQAWLYEQVARGRYRMPGFLTNARLRARWSNVRFRGDGKINLDPAREAKALEVHEAHGWRTGAEITAELTGGDYDANVKRRIGEHERFVAGKLPIPNQRGGGASPASDQEERETE